jgi:hypothetical protein
MIALILSEALLESSPPSLSVMMMCLASVTMATI